MTRTRTSPHARGFAVGQERRALHRRGIAVVELIATIALMLSITAVLTALSFTTAGADAPSAPPTISESSQH